MKRWLAGLGLALALGICCGCGSDEGTGSERTEIRLALNNPAPNFTAATVEATGETVYVSPNVSMTGRDVKSAEVLPSRDGPAVAVEFTRSGSAKLLRFTTENKGKRMAILLQGPDVRANDSHVLIARTRVALAPLVGGPLGDGKMLIGGKLTPARAAELAEALGSPPRK